MNSLTLGVLVVVTMVASVTADKRYYDLKDAETLFEKYIKDYNKHYKDDADREVHFEAFKKSLEDINVENEKNPLATFGLSEFSDYTEEEMETLHKVTGSNGTVKELGKNGAIKLQGSKISVLIIFTFYMLIIYRIH